MVRVRQSLYHIDMIKVGDKVKGFKFEAKKGDGSEANFEIGKVTGLNYNPEMDLYVGVEGVVMEVHEETFDVKFEESHMKIELCEAHFSFCHLSSSDYYDIWTYPIKEYLLLQREEKLNELGI